MPFSPVSTAPVQNSPEHPLPVDVLAQLQLSYIQSRRCLFDSHQHLPSLAACVLTSVGAVQRPAMKEQAGHGEWGAGGETLGS